MTAKDLKNALLQEAVQGKLVPQIASEGNARDLLEEIRKEKLSHGFANSYGICDGKNKKTKKSDLRSKSQIRVTKKELPEITEDEIPFEIPESWCWCRLGEIVQLISGQDLQFEMYNSSKKGIPYITGASNFNNGQILINRWTENPKSIAIKDDLLLTCKGTVGEMAFLKEKQVHIARQVMSIRSSEKISLGYVKLYLTTQIESLKSKAKSMIPGIAREDVMSSLIPLPPLAEQKRIVATIEKFMPLIEEYGKKETELKAFNEQIGALTKKAILQEAVQGKLVPQIAAEGNAKDLLEEIRKEKLSHGFANSYGICDGKNKKTKKSDLRSKSQIRVTKKELPEITEDEIPFEIPENWCWCRLGEIVNYKMGKTPPRAESEWWGNKEDTPWISIADMVADGHINKTKEFMSWKAIKEVFNNTVSKAGTLIMSFKLTVGRVSILDIDATHNEAIISIYPYIDSDYCTRNYLFKVLPLLSQNGETKDAIKGRTLNSTSLSNMLIPLPPLNEQKRIVDAIEKLLPLCERLGR